jgi:hypothetical protein
VAIRPALDPHHLARDGAHFFEAAQRWIELVVVDAVRFSVDLLDGAFDLVAVCRALGQVFENEDVDVHAASIG